MLAGRLPWAVRMHALASGLRACAEALRPVGVAGATTATNTATNTAPQPTDDPRLIAERARLARALTDACVESFRAAESRPPRGRFSLARRDDPRARARHAARAAVACWDALPEGDRTVIAAVASPGQHLREPALELASAASSQTRFAVATLIGECADPSAAPIAAALLLDRSPAVADAAEHALVRLASLVASHALDDPDLSTLAGVVDACANHGTGEPQGPRAPRSGHGRRGVFLALLAIAQPTMLRMARAGNRASPTPSPSPIATRIATRIESVLGTGATRDDDAALDALRAVLRFSRSAYAGPRALEWLWRPALARACAHRLLHPRSRADQEALLSGAHLLERASRASALRAGLARATDLALPQDPLTFDEDQRAQIPRVAAILSSRTSADLLHSNPTRHADRAPTRAVPLSDELVSTRLAPLLADPSARVRLALAIHGPSGVRADLAHDAHPLVARSAALRLSPAGALASGRAGDSATRLPARLDRSRHGAVRALAETDRVAWSEQGLAWRVWWHRRARTDERVGLDVIRALLTSRDPREVASGVDACRALALAEPLAPNLATLLSRGALAPREAATVASLLGHAGESPDAPGDHSIHESLLIATSHEDPRVRSNAIEAIVRRARRDVRPITLEATPPTPPTPRTTVASDAPPHQPPSTPPPTLGSRPALESLAADHSHRVRATLLRSILCGDEDAVLRGLGERSALGLPAGSAAEARALHASALVRDAHTELLAMIRSASMPDRLAGVWAAGRVASRCARRAAIVRTATPEEARAHTLRAQLTEVARLDVEPKVRWRAACAVSRLEGDLRARWSTPWIAARQSDPTHEEAAT